MARIVAGEPEALAEAFELYSEPVYRLAYGITRSLSDSEDVVQDVFVGLPEGLAVFEGRARLSTWLYRVAVRTAMMRLRQDRVWNTVPLDFASASRLGEVTRPIDRVALERALNDIPDEYRVVIWLKIVEEWTHAEIAETLGISESASHVRVHRGREMLRKALTGRR